MQKEYVLRLLCLAMHKRLEKLILVMIINTENFQQ